MTELRKDLTAKRASQLFRGILHPLEMINPEKGCRFSRVTGQLGRGPSSVSEVAQNRRSSGIAKHHENAARIDFLRVHAHIGRGTVVKPYMCR